ncbi:Protein of unknown function [Thalassolituus maritimus]|uniref:DUF2806 domain-containing protein n=2 Tax=Thalassolituus maritimus TaxID=484498 RepID=A0A1N7L0W7_9GAMM|nr:Protein of unknown function [Thalassolituus maritimus]
MSIHVAEDVLSQDVQEPSDRDVDDDWLYFWRDYEGKVSAEELQELWGRVLAGEVKNPGTYSVRTLDFLKVLSREEAELISKAAQFVIDGRIFRGKDEFLEESGLILPQMLHLQDIGVLSGLESLGFKATYTSIKPDCFYLGLVASNRILLIEGEDTNKEAEAEVYLVTSIGREVLKLASFKVNEGYLKSVAKDYVKKGFKVSVADWTWVSDREGRYSNRIEITDNA